jgi:ABC-type glycerol-3-phosphate transport system substrate-binding protein
MKKKVAIALAVFALALSLGAAAAWAVTADTSSVASACAPRPAMKLYIDTHDKAKGTFPASITPEQLHAFYASYVKAAQEEGVVIVRTYVNAKDGRAFCINMAKSPEAIRRMHAKVGLPYDSITQEFGVSPTDLLLNE